MRHLLKWGLLLIVLMLGVSSAGAQLGGEQLPEGVSGDDVYRVSSQLYCDVCAGVPLSSCPSPTCLRWRQEIANLLGQGRSDEEIFSYFAENHGGEVTGVPLERGQRNVALGFPLLMTLVLGLLVMWQIWRIRARGETRAQLAARQAGTRPDYDRPVPDNVDAEALARFMTLVNERK